MSTVIVVGGGLIGSAAARHLREAGHDVLLLTGTEKVSSHDDRFRVQSVRGKDDWWTALNQASVAAWPALEARTGIRFHHPVGCVWSTGPLTRWGDGGRYEPPPAGAIAPKALIAAQQRAFLAIGGRIEAVSARSVGPGVVQTDAGDRTADHVLLAAGVMSPFLLGRTAEDLDLQIESETVLQARLGRAVSLPALLHDGPHDNFEGAWDVYATPPSPDPSGGVWVKLGANLDGDQRFETVDGIRRWMLDDDGTKATTDGQRAILERLLGVLLPDEPVLEARIKRCIIARTSSGRPHLKTLARTGAGALHLATGGNGYAAMSSEGLGALAAGLIDDGAWAAEIERRVRAVENGDVELVSQEDVDARIRSRLADL